MGGDTQRTFSSLCDKAGVGLVFSTAVNKSCCGQIFSSKGFADAHKFTINQAIERIYNDSQEGKIPVVLDVTSCTQTLLNGREYLTAENKTRFDALQILDIIDFAADVLLPRLKIENPKDRIVFHPVCSVHKLGTMGKLQQIGAACSKEAEIPIFAKCCGMAGDRGFYYPELTDSATKKEATEVNEKIYDGYYSTSKTCEVAMSEAVGKKYEPLLNLLDEVSV